jgi:hypothetical protein
VEKPLLASKSDDGNAADPNRRRIGGRDCRLAKKKPERAASIRSLLQKLNLSAAKSRFFVEDFFATFSGVFFLKK